MHGNVPTGGPRVLVIDDDPTIVELLEMALRAADFDVLTALGGAEGLRIAIEELPDVVLTDIMMPEMDGYELCRQLRNHPKTRYMCVLMLTALASQSDKVKGLRAGGDDFITKPFDPDEVVERIRAALRRSQQMAALNPLTGLPGNIQTKHEVENRLSSGDALALMHVDVDNFKAFNDFYGFSRGDEAIVQLRDTLFAAAEGFGKAPVFVGHVGGDDMIVVSPPGIAEDLAYEIVSRWDRNVTTLYDDHDVERGHIEMTDRYGETRHFTPMTLSIGIAVSSERPVSTYRELSSLAAQMKTYAKREPRSAYRLDRRRGELRDDEIPRGKTLDEQIAPRSVLVVDDDEMMRSVLRQYLEDRGFLVFEATDGVDGFQAAREHRPSFVVLDFRMPELNGRFAAEVIRDVVPDCFIVAMSAYLDTTPDWADTFLEKHRVRDLPDILEALLPVWKGTNQDSSSRSDSA